MSKKRRKKKKAKSEPTKQTEAKKPAAEESEDEASVDGEDEAAEPTAEASDDGEGDSDGAGEPEDEGGDEPEDEGDDEPEHEPEDEDEPEPRPAKSIAARRESEEIDVPAPVENDADADADENADEDEDDDDDDGEIVVSTPPPARVARPARELNVTTARLLALIPGFHRFYVGRHTSGFLFLVTLGFLGLGTLIDIIRMEALVDSSRGLATEAIDLAPPRDENETVPIRVMKWIDHSFGLAETLFLIMCLLGLIGVASAQAVSMKVYNKSWAWSFDVIRYSVFFIAMAGAALAAQQERQISMDFVAHNISAHLRARLRFVLRLFVVLICVILFFGGLKLREAAGGAYELVPPKLGVSALPVGALLIAFHMVMHNLIDVLYWVGGKEPPEPEQAAV